MESVLIVSSTEQGVAFFTDLLGMSFCERMTAAASCAEARRLLLERDFELVIINAPLRDESGESLARQFAAKGFGQVILVVKSEYYDEVSAICEEDGVLTVAKPVNKALLWSALKLAKAAQCRLRRLCAENSKLTQKIEDISIVDRAKCLLISYLQISEQEAHRSIEKQAMDMRTTKRAVAESILKTYEG